MLYIISYTRSIVVITIYIIMHVCPKRNDYENGPLRVMVKSPQIPRLGLYLHYNNVII